MLHLGALGRLKTRDRATQDQIAGVDNARTFRIDHSDKFRSHIASVLVYCYLFFIFKYLLFCTIASDSVIDKVQQRSIAYVVSFITLLKNAMQYCSCLTFGVLWR